MKAKSLNDIIAQWERCRKTNQELTVAGLPDRVDTINEAASNARSCRGLSVFDADRDIKK